MNYPMKKATLYNNEAQFGMQEKVENFSSKSLPQTL